MQALKPGFKKIRQVTLPLFKLKAGDELYIQAMKPMALGKEINAGRNANPDVKKKEPAMLMECINLETGELGQIICGAVLKGIFNDEYADGSYVGKSFAVAMFKVDGKDYNSYTVVEIEADEGGGAAVEETGGAGVGERHTGSRNRKAA